MKIIINDFSSITHKQRAVVVEEYCKLYENRINHKDGGAFNDSYIEYQLQETGKYPVVVKAGYSNFHVKCHKTKTAYVFDIWLAV